MLYYRLKKYAIGIVFPYKSL